MPTYGDPNSTLNDELNRLANGGTYRATSEMVDMALAARQWAAQQSITLSVTDTVGVLNQIAQISSKTQWKDLSGICNYIAGTSGLTAAAALREVPGTTPSGTTWNAYDPLATWNSTSPSLTWNNVA